MGARIDAYDKLVMRREGELRDLAEAIVWIKERSRTGPSHVAVVVLRRTLETRQQALAALRQRNEI